VSRDVLVTLLITVVLGDVVKVITTDNEGTLHLGRDDGTSKDTTLDVDLTDIRTLLIDVDTGLGFLGGLETVTNFLEPTLVALLGILGVLEDTSLLLESLFGLITKWVNNIFFLKNKSIKTYLNIHVYNEEKEEELNHFTVISSKYFFS
jgi:hypothetical protein